MGSGLGSGSGSAGGTTPNVVARRRGKGGGLGLGSGLASGSESGRGAGRGGRGRGEGHGEGWGGEGRGSPGRWPEQGCGAGRLVTWREPMMAQLSSASSVEAPRCGMQMNLGWPCMCSSAKSQMYSARHHTGGGRGREGGTRERPVNAADEGRSRSKGGGGRRNSALLLSGRGVDRRLRKEGHVRGIDRARKGSAGGRASPSKGRPSGRAGGRAGGAAQNRQRAG